MNEYQLRKRQLQLEEWRYRHDFFWNAVVKWVTALVAVSAVPYVSETVVGVFGYYTVSFPLFAFLIGTFAFIHLLNEHARALYLRWQMKYRPDTNRFINSLAPSIVHKWLRYPLRTYIGPYLFAVLAFGLLVIPAFNLSLSTPWLKGKLKETDPGSWILPAFSTLETISIIFAFVLFAITLLTLLVHWTSAVRRRKQADNSSTENSF